MDVADAEALKPNELDPTPKYLQIARKMTDLIEKQVWRQDHGIPSERQLVELLDVSRVTARRALQVMEEKGLLVRRPGSGTFVAPHLNQTLSRLSSFSEELKLRGMKSRAKWLLRDVAQASSQELIALGLQSGARVARVKRLRIADDTPMAVEYCRVPETVLPDPNAIDESLYALLDERGTPIVRALQTISAVNAVEEHAKLLDVEVGDAVIFVTRLGYARDGRAIELTESYCRPDVYEFVAELARTPAMPKRGIG
ncbi:MAG: GntR family transcriptional regulator [Casimicrobium sp.]